MSRSGSRTSTALVMGLLERHVPLVLLVDLADPTGPRSTELFESEASPCLRARTG